MRMLFKQLTSANEALVELAHQALGVVINHTRMPKVSRSHPLPGPHLTSISLTEVASQTAASVSTWRPRPQCPFLRMHWD